MVQHDKTINRRNIIPRNQRSPHRQRHLNQLHTISNQRSRRTHCRLLQDHEFRSNIQSSGRIPSGQQLTVQAGGADITGDSTVTGTFDVTSSSTIGAVLNVNGVGATSTFAGFINVNGQNSTSTFEGNLEVGGILLAEGGQRVCVEGACPSTVTGGQAGQVTFWDTSSSISGSADFLWDSTKLQFTVGTDTPETNAVLTVNATSTNSIPLVIRGADGHTADYFRITNSGATSTYFSVSNTGSTTIRGPITAMASTTVQGQLTANTASSTFAGINTVFINAGGNIQSSGRITSGQQLTVQAGGADITGDSTVTGTFDVTSSSTIGAVLNVNGVGATSTFAGFINVNGQNSTSTFEGNLEVGGILLAEGGQRVCVEGACPSTVTGGQAGQVTFWDTSSSISGSADFLWDSTKLQFTVGTDTPETNAVLTVNATSTNSIPLVIRGADGHTADYFRITNSGATSTYFSVSNTGSTTIRGPITAMASTTVQGQLTANTASSTFAG